MKKFKFLITNSLARKIKSKGFIISQIITTVLVLGISLVPAIIKLVSKEKETPKYETLLINETTDNLDIVNYLKLSTNEIFILNITEKASDFETDINDFYETDKYDLIIHFKAGSTTNLIDLKEVNLYSKISSDFEAILKSIISTTKFALLEVDDYYILVNDKLDPSEEVEDGTLQVIIMAFSTIIFTIVFMFIIMSTQTLGAEILEEKSTKAIETIISSVPAETHFYAKIISSITFTALQIGIMVLTGFIGLTISNIILKTKSDSLANMIPMDSLSSINLPMVLLFSLIGIITGLLVYLIIFGFLASFANNNEEYQKAQSPLMIILLIVFYGSMILGTAGLTHIIRWLAYIPFLTPFLLPIALLSGEMLMFEGLIVIIISGLFIFLLTKIIVPTYRVSILDYSGDKLFKSIKRSFKARAK